MHKLVCIVPMLCVYLKYTKTMNYYNIIFASHLYDAPGPNDLHFKSRTNTNDILYNLFQAEHKLFFCVYFGCFQLIYMAVKNV